MNLATNLNKVINKVEEFGDKLVQAQEIFVQSDLYDILNNALDTGIRVALPDIAEDVVIDIKDSLFENGLKNGIKEIWNNTKEFGKSAFGLISGKFESIEQIKTATKNGGVLDVLSKVFDFALDKSSNKGKFSNSVIKTLKSKKNTIIKDIKSKVSENLDNQENYIGKISEYNIKWQNCFDNKDLNGMKNANRNIKKYLEKTLPLENILKQARKIEIMQNFVESTGKFDITEGEIELVTALAN